ncbi:MAG: MBL fold metallo-hydrolase [Desulfuromonadaceae bacterium]|nr:MBL fold metallo-hydrolase [Desulfuromonadaceae bacterium]
MRICQLASGSKGNSIYIESDSTRLLIDAGLSARELTRRLLEIGVAAEDLDAVIISHEHRDHCIGAGPLCRRYNLPLYCLSQTFAALPAIGAVNHCVLEIAGVLRLHDLEVETFPVTHDAVAPVGFVLTAGGARVGIATDLGVVTRLVRERLQRCQVLVLETNHDEQMLHDGPYPWHLKQRIRGSHGHLSNNQAAELLGDLLWPELQAVFMAHISETNNTMELARQRIDRVLNEQNRCRPQLIIGQVAVASESFNCRI